MEQSKRKSLGSGSIYLKHQLNFARSQIEYLIPRKKRKMVFENNWNYSVVYVNPIKLELNQHNLIKYYY
jgi:hypothetical protein